MKRWRLVLSVEALCRLLGVSRSGYYAWLERRPSSRAQEDERLKMAIGAIHQRTRETYGARRVQRELAEDGFMAGRDRVERLRRALGLRCKQKRQFRVTTNSAHHLPVAPNLLEQRFEVERPNQVWVSDLTYIPTEEGWLYLAGIKDLFTREIVGYAMGERMTQDLVSQALTRAIEAKRPSPGLILHSDRGSQYCALAYRHRLERYGLRASMSRRGNCFDNAPMESFWGSLKTELVHHQRYASRTEAKASIRWYIEIFYNRQRRHSQLGYLAPAIFAMQFDHLRAAA